MPAVVAVRYNFEHPPQVRESGTSDPRGRVRVYVRFTTVRIVAAADDEPLALVSLAVYDYMDDSLAEAMVKMEEELIQVRAPKLFVLAFVPRDRRRVTS